MFNKLYNKEDASFNDENAQLEEQYQKLFKKIARDFVYKEDLMSALNNLTSAINLLNSNFNSISVASTEEGAIQKAIEYESNLKKRKKDRTQYKDVDETTLEFIRRTSNADD